MRALDGVTMSVAAGELVALYGPSGSGKTTLLLMVAALLAPDSGEVLVDGRAVSSFLRARGRATGGSSSASCASSSTCCPACRRSTTLR